MDKVSDRGQRGMVTVIIPTYNRAPLLATAVRSAVAQSLPPAEIVVVDDGSTDSTPVVAAELTGITSVRQENAGPSAARNRGLGAARGDYVAFLDSDDLWDLDFLATLVRVLETHPEIGFAFANWRGVDVTGAETYADYMATCPYYSRSGQPGDDLWRVLDAAQARELFVAHSAAPSSAVVVRRHLAVAWDDTIRIGEDNLFLLEVLLRHGCGCAFTTRPLWSKRSSSENLFDGNRDGAELAQRHLDMLQALLGRHRQRLSLPERQLLRTTMARDWHDWGYWEARRGQRVKALRLYASALLARPSWSSLRGLAALLAPRRTLRGTDGALD